LVIFSACAQETIDTSTNTSSTNNSSNDCGIQWEILNSSDKVKEGSMKISADPRVINKLSRIERGFLSNSPVQ
jgi:hypothetical protein